MAFDDYVTYLATPENLRREDNRGARIDRSGSFREAFQRSRLTDDQAAALRWLIAQPNPPARMLVISEDWSSDCRRDVPTFARMAALSGMELRIFNRGWPEVFDGQCAARPGESTDETRARADREFGELINSPWFRIWTSATVDVILSALHRKAILGEV